MNGKEILGNQIKTDIELWLKDLEVIDDSEIFSPVSEAKRIMEKMKKYLL